MDSTHLSLLPVFEALGAASVFRFLLFSSSPGEPRVLRMLCFGLALALGAVGMARVVQGKSPAIWDRVSYLSCESVLMFWFRPVVGAAMCFYHRGEALVFPVRWWLCHLLGCQGHE